MKVLKFGGSSQGSARMIRNVAELAAGAGKNLVVLSAISGTTDSLAAIAACLYNKDTEGFRKGISSLRAEYDTLIRDLYRSEASGQEAAAYVASVFDYLESLAKQPFTRTEEKVILAQGELLSTRMMAILLREMGVECALIPALDFMKTDLRGEPDTEFLRDRLKAAIAAGADADIYLTQGFICLNALGEIDNLGRGGSDYTASLAGAAIDAEQILIWTVYDGLHDNDPRVVEGTRPVRHLHFEEAAELSYFGSRILHPTCIQPARLANIPVHVLNVLDPSAPGTLISNDPGSGTIKAVAAKDNITAIRIKSSRMLLANGFLRRVFEIFESYQTSIDMICTSEVGVSMSIDNTRHLSEIVHDLKRYGTVTVDLDMCIICVVGDMDWENVGFEARALDALRDIPVRMVSFGGSNYNISFLVKGEDKERALRALSKTLF